MFKAARERAETLAKLSDLPADVTSLVRHRADVKLSSQLKRIDDTAVQSFGAQAYRQFTVVVAMRFGSSMFELFGQHCHLRFLGLVLTSRLVAGVQQQCS